MKDKRKKLYIILFIPLCLLVLFLWGAMYYKAYIYPNIPSEISKELQQLIEKEGGEKYKLDWPKGEETGISSVWIAVDEEHFYDEDFFREINVLKNQIYKFAVEHPENFEIFPRDDTGEKDRFRVCFKDESASSGREVAISFSNYSQSTNDYVDDLSVVRVGNASRYDYKLSDLAVIEGMTGLSVTDIVYDGEEFFREMTGLQYLNWDGEGRDEVEKMKEKYNIE